MRRILYIILTSLTYTCLSCIHHVKYLSLYLKTYYNHPFGKFKGEKKTLSNTHTCYVMSQ